MGTIVPFRTAGERAAELDLAVVATRLIDELGDQAGHSVGSFARSAALPRQARRRLLAVAEEIARQQGFGWHFADYAETDGSRLTGSASVPS